MFYLQVMSRILYEISSSLLVYPIQEQIITVLIHLIKDFSTSLLGHLDSCTYCNKILKSRVSRRIDRCGMLAVVAFSAKCQVVCRCQMPYVFAIGIFAYKKTEILAMVIFIISKVIEHHSAVHLLYILRTLREITRQCKQITIIVPTTSP